jgi:hypothetical protein
MREPRGGSSPRRYLPERKPPPRGAPGDHAEPLLQADRQDLALYVALHERVLGLQTDEPLEAVRFAHGQAPHELPTGEVRDADVAHLPAAHEVGEGREGLFQRCGAVPTMNLIEIDVVGAESPEAVLAPLRDVLAREAGVVGALAHRKKDFRGEHDVVAHSLYRPARDFLGDTL